MKCVKCNETLKCVESRDRPDGSRRRRYKCPKCGEKYSTVEKFTNADVIEYPVPAEHIRDEDEEETVIEKPKKQLSHAEIKRRLERPWLYRDD